MSRQRAQTQSGAAYELKMAILNTAGTPTQLDDLQRTVGRVFDFNGAHISQINIAQTMLIDGLDVGPPAPNAAAATAAHKPSSPQPTS